MTSTNHRTIAGIAGGILASLAALTACGTTSSTPAAHRPPSIAAQEKTWLASGGRAQTQRVITDLKTIQRDANNYDMAIDQVKADGSQLNADAKLAQGNLPPGPAHQDYGHVMGDLAYAGTLMSQGKWQQAGWVKTAVGEFEMMPSLITGSGS